MLRQEKKYEMNRPMIKIVAVAMLAACCAASGDAYAANPPRGRFGTQTAATASGLLGDSADLFKA